MNATGVMGVLDGLLLAATPAGAITGQDFLQVSDKSAVDEMAVLKPLVRQFVREGYQMATAMGISERNAADVHQRG